MKIQLKRLFKNSYFLVISGLFVTMAMGGILISFLEEPRDITRGNNPFWWAVVSMTTVGYGDLIPQTLAGRLLAVIVIFGGISFTSLLTATISSAFVAKRIREEKGLEKLDITGHVILCGWNKNVDRILDSLQSLSEGKTLPVVLINDESEDVIAGIRNKFREAKFNFVRGDFTKESVLEQANLNEATTVIILPGEGVKVGSHPDEKTVLATLTIKTLAPKVRVVAYILERENLTHIKRANADEVILSDDFGAYIVASHVMVTGIPQTIERLLDSRFAGSLKKVSIPNDFIGKTYQELFEYFRSQHGWTLVSVFSEEEQIGLGAILSSDTSALDAFIERKLKEAGHTLGEETKMNVIINPKDTYIIKENEQAVVIQ